MGWNLFSQRSTGWLDLRPFLTNGWTGIVIGVREGSDVRLRVEGLSAAGATSGIFLELPLPLTPSIPSGAGSVLERFLLHTADSTPVFRRGSINGRRPTIAGRATSDVLYGGLDYRTTQPWSPIEAVKL